MSELETIEVDHALHKWQFATHDCILQLRMSRPNVASRVILLWREPHEHRERIALKGLWKPVPSIAQLQHDWQSKIVPRFAALKGKIPVEIVDAGKNDYPIRSELWIDEV